MSLCRCHPASISWFSGGFTEPSWRERAETAQRIERFMFSNEVRMGSQKPVELFANFSLSGHAINSDVVL
jgi:hypothetical protein